MIPVTKPFLPKIEEFENYVKSIWDRQWLTNNGPLVNDLELKLKQYLNVDYLLYVSNGTIALQMAIRALELKGEIITTPFSFVATTNSILWQGCKPVYVDIDPDTFNIDPGKIEAAITPRTSAILATHVYGNPCDIDAIQNIADKYGLKVIYDAAHCFGTKYKNRSVFAYGDISITSFHATKLFHTIEGGAVFTKKPELLEKMAFIRNFGYSGPDTIALAGINAKNSEFHAAMGLCNLGHIDAILEKRRSLSLHYRENLKKLKVKFQFIDSAPDYNYAYCPILFDSEELMHDCIVKLELAGVYCRRYFFPSLATLPFVSRKRMPVCDSVVKRIVCLPLYDTLTIPDLDMISRILLRAQKYPVKTINTQKGFGELIANRIEKVINGHEKK
ncbi:DegT/DnrJ/EryC1/StrS family aminotransferase [Sphingobacterium sp. DR205]|uniref:DegT/DnrJ/EryC1/StrS family aminotransferase n=1 Tax=Sphingobacterium sp. DR205 TaxID=2713573 RepID=UPI0013E4DCEF|nr:DegT/DnrJ/EryC1/StrS family aminotransferase [Sphingobacterium sp. DR205]QIH32817.1 DegT/DnrJ/EryC1/StrS family aminotransferase [Sphingobacterium sp. DR205]